MQIAKPRGRHKNGSAFTHNVIVPTSLKSMDLTRPKQFKPPSEPAYGKSLCGNPFADDFPDPVCKVNLKETNKSIQGRDRDTSVERRGVVQRRAEAESPSTPSFRFSAARKSCPSKWDDAEKWLMTHHSPATALTPSQPHLSSLTRINANALSDVPLTDKYTDDVHPKFRYSEASKDGFAFRNPMKNASTEVDHVGTEMTTSRPFKSSSSPARHNTPTNRSGFLAMVNSMEVCHLAKLQLGTQYDSVASNWSSKEEEEEQSLRHFDTSNDVSESTAASLEQQQEEEKIKCCLRYQREEAKIQAWVNLEKAKAEAQSRKLEVRIQKMRSEQEEKLMKRMVAVQRKAQDWRISAEEQHSEQVQRAGEQIQKMINRHNSQLLAHRSCACFPCNIP